MGTCVHFSRSLPSNSWWQTMVGWQVLSRPSADEGGGRRPAFTGLATQPYSATEVDGWQHKLSRRSQKCVSFQSGLPAPVTNPSTSKLSLAANLRPLSGPAGLPGNSTLAPEQKAPNS